MIGDVTVANESLVNDWESKDVAFALVGLAPGTDAEQLKRAEDQALSRSRPPKPQTIAGLQGRAEQGRQRARRR